MLRERQAGRQVLYYDPLRALDFSHARLHVGMWSPACLPRLTRAVLAVCLYAAHDGSIQRFSPSGPYYMHAVSYGLCQAALPHGCDPTPDHCGFRQDHNISVYTSPDLSNGSWQYVADAIAIEDRPPGTVFRPSLVFNPHTRHYVLWWNYVSSQVAWVPEWGGGDGCPNPNPSLSVSF